MQRGLEIQIESRRCGGPDRHLRVSQNSRNGEAFTLLRVARHRKWRNEESSRGKTAEATEG